MLPLLICMVVFLSSVLYWKNKRNTPPGPIGLPLLGYMPFLDADYLHRSIEKLRQRYGPVFSIQLGSWPTVVISDYDLIKKTLQLKAVSDRPPFIILQTISHGGYGLLSSNGHLWSEQRRFTLRHLRDLGMGKLSMEEHVIQEAKALGNVFVAKAGQPTDLSFDLNISMANIVWALVAGKRMKYDDPFCLGLMKAVSNNVQLTRMGIFMFLPWLANCLPDKLIGKDALKKSLVDFESYAEKEIEEHRKTLNPENIRDFIDCYLVEMQKQKDSDSTFSHTQLLVSIGDLLGAGGETTSTTLRWAILLLSKFQEVQNRVREEIDEIVGRERSPCLNDQPRMPYTDAVIHEVQRFADIAPLGLFHYTSSEIELGGYIVPKETLITPFTRRIHRDPKYWAKPDEFYPEHFLSREGKLVIPTEGFMPFLIGRRQCIGVNLARMKLFIFLTYFLQHFEFSLAPESVNVSLEGKAGGLIVLPDPYKVFIGAR